MSDSKKREKTIRKTCRAASERKEDRDKREKWYKTAFITQHVLWTDGGELCIKAFTLFLYFCSLEKKLAHMWFKMFR